MADSLVVLADRLSTRPWLFGLFLFLAAFAICAAIGTLGGLPLPKVHDEFSYLLASDTFASGRLANATHPMWEHFETYHVIQKPTYVSKYPPAQGLFLALGQVLTGKPIVGVWISVSLMCWAIYWMLLAWLPARWAVAGGTVALLQFGTVTYWAHSYWGGAVAALGGALVFGSVRRLVDDPRLAYGILLGMGLGILANSRPFEGFVAGLFAGSALLAAMFSANRGGLKPLAVRALPTLLVLTGFAAAMGLYNRRTTGDPLTMPYEVHARTYSASSEFSWKTFGPLPTYRHEAMRDFYLEYGRERVQRLRTPPVFAWLAVLKLTRLHYFFLGAAGLLPLLGLPRALREGWTQFAVATVATVVGLSLFTNANAHYVAPVAGLILLVAMGAMRHLWQMRWSRISGKQLIFLTFVFLVASFWAQAYVRVTSLSFQRAPGGEIRLAYPAYGFAQQRADIIAEVGTEEGKHLIVVRYLDGHRNHSEWVYNRADIDESRIVWARDMGPRKNREILDYFRDRTGWILTVGMDDARVPLYGAEKLNLRRSDVTVRPVIPSGKWP